jgi:hypothetical protein
LAGSFFGSFRPNIDALGIGSSSESESSTLRRFFFDFLGETDSCPSALEIPSSCQGGVDGGPGEGLRERRPKLEEFIYSFSLWAMISGAASTDGPCI